MAENRPIFLYKKYKDIERLLFIMQMSLINFQMQMINSQRYRE